MKAKTKRRVMKEFVINELSGVDSPAQEGAQALILKRDTEKRFPSPGEDEDEDKYVSRFMGDEKAREEYPDEEQRAAVAHSSYRRSKKNWGGPGGEMKNPRLTSLEAGHQHLLDDTGQSGYTSHEKSVGEEYPHAHAWIRNAAGLVEVGASEGHSHSVSYEKGQYHDGHKPDGLCPMGDECPEKEARRQATVSTNQSAGCTGDESLNKESTMTPEEKAALEKREAELRREVESLRSVVALSASERAHFDGLNGSDRDNFLKLSAGDRRAEVEKAAAANPVVYKSEDGIQFRASDDPRLAQMAKDRDADRKTLREERAARETAQYEKRASEEFGNLPGDATIKVAVLRAVSGIADEKVREGAWALLKAGNDALKPMFNTIGRRDESGQATGDPLADLEVLSQKFAKERGMDIVKARSEVLRTPEGAALVLRSRGMGR